MNRKGFHALVLKEAVEILNDYQAEKNQIIQTNSRVCYCQEKMKIGIFYPIASIFQVFIAYILLLPVPFVDAWLLQIDHKNKGGTSASELDFLFSNTLTTKIKWSIEYFNFVISLIMFSIQYPSITWTSNKLFSIASSLLEFLIILHILIDFPIISIVIKNYFKNCTHCINGSNATLAYSCLLLMSSVIGNIFLLLTFFSIFHFAHEKFVQTLLKSSWLANNYRQEVAGSPNNIDQFTYQSNASSSVLYSSEKLRNIRTSLYSFTCAALFFIVGITVKGLIYNQYKEFRTYSKLFIIYLVQSLILVIIYFMFWFGISVKPKWGFSIKEFEKNRNLSHSAIPREESNYYKSLKHNLKSSQISLSSASNTNISLHSSQFQSSNRTDFTSPETYMRKYNSLKLMVPKKENQDYTDYLQVNQHLPQPRIYKTMYGGITSPKPYSEDRKDSKQSSNNYYKCGNIFALKKPMDNIRCEEPFQMCRKPNMEFPIQEEGSNENISSVSDEISSNVTSSPNVETMNKNNSNMKFVTFRLDNNAEILAEMSNSSSNGSLTVISLEQSDIFLKELDGEISSKTQFSSFKRDINSSFHDKLMLPLESKSSNSSPFTSTMNQAQISLL